MKKNNITNKITPCCGLPFSVAYWWIENLTLNSDADRVFIRNKLHQNGTIGIDGWKVLINSGTLEADASLTKAEFLAWFNCERQPSCEQLKLIIEGYKLSNYNPTDEYGVGWTEIFIYEDYNGKIIKKITGYVGGIGVMPDELSDRIGFYYGDEILTDNKNLAVNFKGQSGANGTANLPQFADLQFPVTNTATEKVQCVDNFVPYQLLDGKTSTSADTPSTSPTIWKSMGLNEDMLIDKNVLKKENSYFAKEEFFDDSGNWTDYAGMYKPLWYSASGVLTLDFTSGNEILRWGSFPVYSGTMTVKVRFRALTTGGTSIVFGTAPSETNTTYSKVFTPTTSWQEETFTLEAVTTSFIIMSLGAGNLGDTIEIDYIYVDEVINGDVSVITTTLSEVINSESDDLQSIVSVGGLVQLKPKEYNISVPLDIPKGTKIVGIQGLTKVNYYGVGDCINLNATKSNITIIDVEFIGRANNFFSSSMTPSQVKDKVGIGSVNGIVVSGYAKNIHILNNRIRNFSGVGIKCVNTNGNYFNTCKIMNNVVHQNYLGFWADVRGEYHQIIGNSFCYNKIGAWIEGGNIAGSTNHFNGNNVGLVLSGTSATNDTHGTLSACQINHNASYSIFCIDVNNGFSFNGCHCYDGRIYIENSKGINFCGGVIHDYVEIVNPPVNSSCIFANNMFIYVTGSVFIGDTTNFALKNNRFIGGENPTVLNN